MTRTMSSPRFQPALRRINAQLSRFRREDDGTVTIFGVYLAILILMLGGIAVDVMRSESIRTSVQNVEDTAVLAAANLDQSLDPKSVVQDYFAKAGMSDYLQSVIVTSAANYKKVSVVATSTMPTSFMRLEGINTIHITNNATADQSIGDVEIALALDNSGSMTQAMNNSSSGCTSSYGSGYGRYSGYHSTSYSSCTSTSKIEGLKTAADEFVDTMFTNSAAGTITMSIFPYDSHVNIGSDLLKYLNVSTEQTKARCVDFTANDFTTTAISATATLQRTGYADLENNTTNINDGNVECNDASYRDSIVFSADPTALKNTIDNMQAGGYTSIDSGVKWAAASLDPAWQPVVDGMINDGKLATSYSGRPVAYNDSSNMKVLIVMSDGENTSRYQLKPGYYSGNSPYYANVNGTTNTGIWSFEDTVNHPNTPYYWSVDGGWHSKPFDSSAGTYTYCKSYFRGVCSQTATATATGTAEQWSYPTLWANMSAPYYKTNVLSAVYGSSTASAMYNNIVDVVSSTTMDSNLHTMCSTAKSKGVLIYAIGFQTSTHGASTLQDCASAPSFYFDAQGTEISSVFAKIATSIEHLRLTQ
ncbi:TadE/TadG family type IV pilus assembly protein [Solirhodobacter olei]|uniref:TadE/TadG family type IV pilus assembly protein n=1 Tax=Solirhodobacter olei TaxID=2493082 RepID=UPI000FDAAF80|nr:TadE/TadG family type IV pilus assembly protein [Solirhodobacter olei]